ncbi:MAG: hypothetical protein ACR2K6_09575 [Solirubrobacterales bacterium]
MIHATDRNPFVTARLYVMSTLGGGYSHWKLSGYRAHWFFRDSEGVDTGHDGAVLLPEGQRLEPGESRDATICPFAPHFWEDLKEGDVIEMWDSHTVGVATIIEPLVTP